MEGATGRTRQGGAFRTGEVAAAAGLSRQTVHQYVLLGLIRPRERTAGGHRVFGGGVFRRLDEIRALQGDHTLAQIREIFAARTQGRGRGRRT